MTDEEKKAKQREYQKEYRRNHPDMVREINRKYRQNHPEKVREYNRLYVAKNREKVNERQRLWREAHREHYRMLQKKSQIRVAKRRAAENAANTGCPLDTGRRE